jgi:putative selenate reductase
MAQNIVLAWLGGARMFELKTVQILDELEIGRPCIDMQTIGYNIEWSQELKVHESREEYVKAWMAIDMLRRWEPISEHIVTPDRTSSTCLSAMTWPASPVTRSADSSTD